MLKTVRVHDPDETSVEYASVRRVVEPASGQVRLELDLDERAEISQDVILPAGTAYDLVNHGVYETSRSQRLRTRRRAFSAIRHSCDWPAVEPVSRSAAGGAQCP
jgi:hypothetical protein